MNSTTAWRRTEPRLRHSFSAISLAGGATANELIAIAESLADYVARRKEEIHSR